MAKPDLSDIMKESKYRIRNMTKNNDDENMKINETVIVNTCTPDTIYQQPTTPNNKRMLRKEDDDDLKDTVVLNIGGTIFETTYETLRREHGTLLGALTHTSTEYNQAKGYYFFDRNPEIFNCILDLYRTGELHLPVSYCGATLRQELKFWQIPENRIADCCLQTFFKYDNDKKVIDILKTQFDGSYLDYNAKEAERNTLVRIKRKIWLFLDQPTSSYYAKVFSYFYLTFVVFSGLLFCSATHEDFRRKVHELDNTTDFTNLNPDNPKQVLYRTTVPVQPLVIGGWLVLFFFSIEFILHFAFCPFKLDFFKSGLNCLDLILFVFMWIVFAFEVNEEVIIANRELGNFYLVLKSTMILRLFRLLRLVKQYSALKILTVSLTSSLKELGLLLITFLMTSVFFASFIYYAEFSEPTTFPHIFIGIWWAVVTMTTVGYGDMFPKSTFGHFVGSACAICGVLILSMPIAIVATKFSNFNDRNNERERRKELKMECHDKLSLSESSTTLFTKVASVKEIQQLSG